MYVFFYLFPVFSGEECTVYIFLLICRTITWTSMMVCLPYELKFSYSKVRTLDSHRPLFQSIDSADLSKLKPYLLLSLHPSPSLWYYSIVTILPCHRLPPGFGFSESHRRARQMLPPLPSPLPFLDPSFFESPFFVLIFFARWHSQH